MARCEDAPCCGCCTPDRSYSDYREDIDLDWWGSADEVDYEDVEYDAECEVTVDDEDRYEYNGYYEGDF